MDWLESTISHIVSLLGQGHPTTLTALFLIVILAEIGIPLPFIPDSALFLTGYQNGFAIQSLYTFLIVFLGRHCGTTFTYWLSRLLGHKLLGLIEDHLPRLSKRINSLLSRLDKKAPFAIAFLRLSGLLYLPSVAAGVVHLPFRYFILGVTISSIIFDGATTMLGILTGHGFRILGFKPTNWSITIGFIIIMIIAVVIRFIVARRKSVK